ncbi:type I restriction enzyme HsdR N-terminal domain-containing protein [Nostoc punctiforme]|uniref:type I restriction enzyme HsdR N-terminal domain-containing protein n=1 Tax=Nostoc punctiforme TaxID=272131 RepID=UPI000038DEB7|nr:type I restriction enzyme HsdR N-terminal domain-containing protein [Nostoc punctiforme]
MKLADILKDSNYKLSQFAIAEIEQLEQTITLKATKNGDVPYTVCLVRQKAIKLTPEEAIRQLYLRVLSDRLHYPLGRIQVEYGVNFGREVKRADIVVMDKDRSIQHSLYARGAKKAKAEGWERPAALLL